MNSERRQTPHVESAYAILREFEPPGEAAEHTVEPGHLSGVIQLPDVRFKFGHADAGIGRRVRLGLSHDSHDAT